MIKHVITIVLAILLVTTTTPVMSLDNLSEQIPTTPTQTHKKLKRGWFNPGSPENFIVHGAEFCLGAFCLTLSTFLCGLGIYGHRLTTVDEKFKVALATLSGLSLGIQFLKDGCEGLSKDFDALTENRKTITP